MSGQPGPSGPLLLGVCGSLRRRSLNRALLQAIAETLPAGSGARLVIFDGLGDIPLFNSDLTEEPAGVAALKEAIRAADGVVFATPEYNYSVSGVLKNALDWASRPPPSPLAQKPVGIVGCSVGMSGSMRAQYHLRQILIYSDSPVLGQPEVLIPRSVERFDADGRLTDESTRVLLARFGEAMLAHVARYA